MAPDPAPASNQPALSGVRILDLTHWLAGPFGSLLLADLGAEIIKVEQPGVRPEEPPSPHKLHGDNAYFLAVNRNKKSVALDLRREEGLAVFYDLVRRCDVVYDNFRLGRLERLRIDYQTLRKINPAIISCSVTGYGSTGPYSDRPAYDLVIQALSGGMSITGDPPPQRAGFPIADLCGGVFASAAIAAALYQRAQTGQGQRIDVALLDTQIAFLTYMVTEYFMTGTVTGFVGTGMRVNPLYRTFRVGDEHIVVAVAAGDHFWQGFCNALGHEELLAGERFDTHQKREQNSEELVGVIEEALRERPAAEWLERLIASGVPAARVNRIDEAMFDPQVRHSNMIVEVPHSRGGSLFTAGNPFKMAGAQGELKSPPVLGEHTQEVLRDLLGYDAPRVKALAESGVIGLAPP